MAIIRRSRNKSWATTGNIGSKRLSQYSRDRENDFKLIAMDWVPMHFWGQEIQKRTAECVEAVEDLVFELLMMQFDGMIEDMRDCVEDIK